MDIFVNFLKKKHFLDFENNFFNSFCSFEGVLYFWVESCIFFSKLLSATSQQFFCVTEDGIGQRPSRHAPLLYGLLVYVMWLTLGCIGVPAGECNKGLENTFHYRNTYLHQIILFYLFFLIFKLFGNSWGISYMPCL